jgi:catechol 2,3-dioxygenase-like lactoylglutathione lyase family enzyme
VSARRAAAVGIRYVHTNIVARDWTSLAAFYVKALGCRRKPPERDLRGAWLEAATSLKGARLRGVHLRLPGYGDDGPTLEIFQYEKMPRGGAAAVNRPGLGHLAFAVKDVGRALARVERCGGGRAGAPVRAEIAGVGSIEFVYARDPEGNVIELQKWG